MKAVFVYPNPRRALLEAIAAGEAPDTNLLGQNHLGDLGLDAWVHEPRLRRRERSSGLRHRLTWNLRELALPWELADADVAVTPLATIFPLAARLRRRPRVVLLSYHLVATYDRSGRGRRRLLAASVRSAAAVACISQVGRDRLVERTGAEPERVHTAPLGVDERFWRPAPPPERDGFVLTVGRDLARDYETFCRAVEALPTRAVLVGKQANLDGVRVPRNVEVRLDISPAEVRELYAGASCVVVPIRGEGYRFGTENSGTIALLEASASGRPVIVTERAYLSDYVRAPETALTVPPEEPDALRAAIERVLADRTLGVSLGLSARRLVEEEHTTRRFAERLAAILGTLDAG